MVHTRACMAHALGTCMGMHGPSMVYNGTCMGQCLGTCMGTYMYGTTTWARAWRASQMYGHMHAHAWRAYAWAYYVWPASQMYGHIGTCMGIICMACIPDVWAGIHAVGYIGQVVQ